MKHGMTNTPTFSTWMSMRKRCNYAGDAFYHRYGGRGIKVCERWYSSFLNFLSDMGERPTGCVLDRINNDGNYEPSNCRWVTQKVSGRNRGNNSVYTINGITACLTELAEKFGINPYLASTRIRSGMSPVEAFTRPVIPKKRGKRLTKEDAYNIRKSYPSKTMAQIARENGVSFMAISHIIRNRNHKV